MARRKEEIVTFKVDAALMEALANIPNRSEFIRAAILQAMDNLCPLCTGTGYLSPEQRKHWDEFTAHHAVRRCEECDSTYLVCDAVTTGKKKRRPIRAR